MTGEAGPVPAFTLEYDIQPQDVRELFVAKTGVRNKLIAAVAAAILWGVSAGTVAAISIVLTHHSGVNGSAVGIYLVDLWLWVFTAGLVRAAKKRSPGRLARVAIKKIPELQGRTRDQVETGGIRSFSANGSEVFVAWATIDRVRETSRAFLLLGHDGHVQTVLPKRALDSPDLLSALRIFLKQPLVQQPLAAGDS